MGIISGPRMGSWTISSKKDPRWNATGEGVGSGSGITKPKEVESKMVELIALYGDPPEDLEYFFCKD